MSREAKKYIHFSTVFQGNGRDQDLQQVKYPNLDLDSHKDIKSSNVKLFKQFTECSNIDQQRSLLNQNGFAIFEAIIEIIDKAHFNYDLIKYVLPLLDGILSDDRQNIQYIIKSIVQNGDKSILQALQRLLQEPKHSITVHEAAAKSIAQIYSQLEPKEYIEKQKEFLKQLLSLRDQKTGGQQVKLGDFNFVAALVHLLKLEPLVKLFLKQGGATLLSTFLENNSGDLQTSYYTLLNVWLISFSEDSVEYFSDPSVDLIRNMTEVIQKLSREKLIRVAFSTFRNLCDMSQETIELMVDAQLIKFIDIQLLGNIKDEEVLEDLKYVGEVLEQNLKILSSFEKYQKELHSQHLEWSPVHSEKFWRENIKKFEDDDFKLIKRLITLLDSTKPNNQAIACYDLGEFCRFHPFGRTVLEAQQGKSRIMLLAKSETQTIRENALLALQKIMLHNWNIGGK